MVVKIKILWIMIYLASEMLNALTTSYFNYLYGKYTDELEQCRYGFSNFCADPKFLMDTNNATVNVFDVEWTYMRTRELKPREVLEIGINSNIFTKVLIMALHYNSKEGFPGRLTTVQTTAKTAAEGFFSSHDDTVHAVIESDNITSLLGISGGSIQYDAFVLGAAINNAQFEWLITNIVEPSIMHRKTDMPALQLYYQVNHRQGGETGPHLIKDNSSLALHHKIRHHGLQANSGLLKWLNGQIHRSIDFEIISQKKVLAAWSSLSKEKTKSGDIYCNILPQHAKNAFGYASVHNSPRITLITPSSRPELLDKIFQSIKFRLIHEWIIVYAHSSSSSEETNSTATATARYGWHPKITELFNTDSKGSWGNPERNIALNRLSKSQQGLLYFLDDDNSLHPNFWTIAQDAQLPAIIFVQQIRLLEGTKVTGTEHVFQSPVCKKYRVDTGVTLMSIDIVVNHSDIRWQPDNHAADGEFLEEVPAAYHDGLYVVDKDPPLNIDHEEHIGEHMD